jgi:hypothetical protein
VLGLEVLDHLVKSRKSFWINGEGTVLQLIVDIKPDHIGGDPFGAKPGGDAPDLGFKPRSFLLCILDCR